MWSNLEGVPRTKHFLQVYGLPCAKICAPDTGCLCSSNPPLRNNNKGPDTKNLLHFYGVAPNPPPPPL